VALQIADSIQDVIVVGTNPNKLFVKHVNNIRALLSLNVLNVIINGLIFQVQQIAQNANARI